MEQDAQVASRAGISGSNDRDTWDYRTWFSGLWLPGFHPQQALKVLPSVGLRFYVPIPGGMGRLMCRGGCPLQVQVSNGFEPCHSLPRHSVVLQHCALTRGSVQGAFSQGTQVLCIMIKEVSLQKESEVSSKPSWRGQHLHFLSEQYWDWKGKLIVEEREKVFDF